MRSMHTILRCQRPECDRAALQSESRWTCAGSQSTNSATSLRVTEWLARCCAEAQSAPRLRRSFAPVDGMAPLAQARFCRTRAVLTSETHRQDERCYARVRNRTIRQVHDRGDSIAPGQLELVGIERLHLVDRAATSSSNRLGIHFLCSSSRCSRGPGHRRSEGMRDDSAADDDVHGFIIEIEHLRVRHDSTSKVRHAMLVGIHGDLSSDSLVPVKGRTVPEHVSAIIALPQIVSLKVACPNARPHRASAVEVILRKRAMHREDPDAEDEERLVAVG